MEEQQAMEQVIDFLEDHKGEVFSAAELSEILNVTYRLLRDKLHTLIKFNEVEFEKITWRVARKIYKDNNLKRGMNLYFLD